MNSFIEPLRSICKVKCDIDWKQIQQPLNRTNSPNYTALDLLNKVIDFTNRSSDSAEWSFEKQKDNPPRLVRLQQIKALMEAFVSGLKPIVDIGRSIKDFYSGDFIIHQPIAKYASLIEDIEKTIAGSKHSNARKREISAIHLQNNYRELLDYYLKLKGLLNHNNKYLEISYPYLFPYVVTEEISASIASKVIKISHLLATFIDPEKQSYMEEELIIQYHYPTEDLLDLDLD